MLTKEALDKFALDITPSIGDLSSFAAKNYKPILGTLAGAYLLSKILPALYDYSYKENDRKQQDIQSMLLANIARNTTGPGMVGPKRDNYQYVF